MSGSLRGWVCCPSFCRYISTGSYPVRGSACILTVLVSVDVAGNMDKAYSDIEQELDEKLSSFGFKRNVADTKSVPNMLRNQGMRLPGRPLMELTGRVKRERQPHLTESVY